MLTQWRQREPLSVSHQTFRIIKTQKVLAVCCMRRTDTDMHVDAVYTFHGASFVEDRRRNDRSLLWHLWLSAKRSRRMFPIRCRWEVHRATPNNELRASVVRRVAFSTSQIRLQGSLIANSYLLSLTAGSTFPNLPCEGEAHLWRSWMIICRPCTAYSRYKKWWVYMVLRRSTYVRNRDIPWLDYVLAETIYSLLVPCGVRRPRHPRCKPMS